ncbi:hypothetical protein NL676_008373 [Syzygium grande]|nr:hypothetical protein NL676_008373 [Syzygium grande]
MMTRELFGPDDGGRVDEEDEGKVAEDNEVDDGRRFYVLEENKVERQCYKVISKRDVTLSEPNVEDWSTDTWAQPGEASSLEKANWLACHRVAVGATRGLTYLHHAVSAHGHLVASNVLLANDLEHRISDFGIHNFGNGREQFGEGGIERPGPAPEADIYFFGMISVELLMGERRERGELGVGKEAGEGRARRGGAREETKDQRELGERDGGVPSRRVPLHGGVARGSGPPCNRSWVSSRTSTPS